MVPGGCCIQCLVAIDSALVFELYPLVRIFRVRGIFSITSVAITSAAALFEFLFFVMPIDGP